MEVEASMDPKWRELATDTSAKHACPCSYMQQWWPLILNSLKNETTATIYIALIYSNFFKIII